MQYLGRPLDKSGLVPSPSISSPAPPLPSYLPIQPIPFFFHPFADIFEVFLTIPEVGLTHISYIFNWCRFMKSSFRVLLLSTFRVSRINYSLVCSLPIHTGSSANVEGLRAHCQLNLCKMLHKCSTDCIWKGIQPVSDLEGHSRSPLLLPFDMRYTISY